MQVHRDLDALPALTRPVVTIGSFDGVHLGHRELLSSICELAQSVKGESVVVTFDPHPRHVLPSSREPLPLLTTTEEKLERLATLAVDHVVVVPFTLEFAAQTPESYLDRFLFGRFSPHTVVIGYDHRFGAKRVGDIHLLRTAAKKRGIAITEIAARDIDALAVSSTRIRAAIRAGNVASASRMLGKPYSLTGAVVHGDAIGRTIGFPTANMALGSPYKLLPADGVYAVLANAEAFGDDQRPKPAMLYIGQRPSLAGLRPRSIEVNVLDFDGDLYGAQLQIDLIAHIRHDQRFAGLDALRAQIELDRLATREVFAS